MQGTYHKCPDRISQLFSIFDGFSRMVTEKCEGCPSFWQITIHTTNNLMHFKHIVQETVTGALERECEGSSWVQTCCANHRCFLLCVTLKLAGQNATRLESFSNF